MWVLGRGNSTPSLQCIQGKELFVLHYLEPITQNLIVFSVTAAKYTDLAELGLNKLFRDHTFTENSQKVLFRIRPKNIQLKICLNIFLLVPNEKQKTKHTHTQNWGITSFVLAETIFWSSGFKYICKPLRGQVKAVSLWKFCSRQQGPHKHEDVLFLVNSILKKTHWLYFEDFASVSGGKQGSSPEFSWPSAQRRLHISNKEKMANFSKNKDLSRF